jgi:5-methylcytosine-specific restriction endonuclease McrA
VRSPSMEMRLPSVVSLKSYVDQDRKPAFTRFNVFLRDGFACQYCGDAAELTFDHVVPRSQGGRTTWENIVAACGPCNLRKGGRTPSEAGMPLLRRGPTRPSAWALQEAGRRFPPNFLHRSWLDYLYWDIELEP